MADKPEQISTATARELIRDGDTDRLIADPRAVDELNQSVIEEFRANQGRVGWPAGAYARPAAYDDRSKNGSDAGASRMLLPRWRAPGNHRILRRRAS